MQLNFEDTLSDGVYIMKWKDAQNKAMVDRFAVNTDPHESNLTRIADDALRELAGRLDPVIVHQARGDVELARKGREIWRVLVFGVLGLLLMESFLTGWVGRKR